MVKTEFFKPNYGLKKHTENISIKTGMGIMNMKRLSYKF